ncbi:hypothetical protein [Plantactinospora soyae]|uniref:Uncharacterized protein n=1 Tax=Plantactinospora soyae TaxID=1544732 RepID=A0A927M577_9ACTN|nr:hypothetical protein [Plantactinospora soyae]MBE1488242.1 hypothetical protein [Plantactinospora soyae]
MSFGTYARKVRDPSRSYGQRINALAGCVERYQPIGYHATFGYLEQVAGHFRREEAALLRAIDALSSSRDLWLSELGTYAKQRKAAKRLGRRNPQAHDLNLNSAACWYGDSRKAALFALGFLLRQAERGRPGRAHTTDAEVLRLSSTCVERRGCLSRTELEQVRSLQTRFQHLRQVAGWPDIDWPNWHKAHDSLWALHLIASACAPQTVDVLS